MAPSPAWRGHPCPLPPPAATLPWVSTEHLPHTPRSPQPHPAHLRSSLPAAPPLPSALPFSSGRLPFPSEPPNPLYFPHASHSPQSPHFPSGLPYPPGRPTSLTPPFPSAHRPSHNSQFWKPDSDFQFKVLEVGKHTSNISGSSCSSGILTASKLNLQKHLRRSLPKQMSANPAIS